MYEFIWNKDTKYMIEIPIYCDKGLNINIAIINFQSKITKNIKIWYWQSNDLNYLSKKIVDKVFLTICQSLVDGYQFSLT